MLFNLRKSSALFALGMLSASSVFPGFAAADVQPDKLVLKSSAQLVPVKVDDGGMKRVEAQRTRSVLANLEMFRGVVVDVDPPAHADVQYRENREKRISSKSEKDNSMIKAVYGGLQIALKDNLSLVYSPGRLSRQGFDSDSEGLYLLTDRGGQVNWYMGVESASYARSSNARRTANSAQFGVILNLD